jgi:hypothetical protein
MKGKKREREGERKKIEKKKREGYHGYYLKNFTWQILCFCNF